MLVINKLINEYVGNICYTGFSAELKYANYNKIPKLHCIVFVFAVIGWKSNFSCRILSQPIYSEALAEVPLCVCVCVCVCVCDVCTSYELDWC
jgi:hypothetical protein